MSYPPQGLDKADVLADLDTLLSRLTEARAGYIDDNFDALHHASVIFPGDTDLIVTFSTGTDAHAWGTWAEIEDNEGTKLSDLIASLPGHITVIQEEELSDINALYMLEIAYGETTKVPLTEQRFAGTGKFQSPRNLARTYGVEIPAGEKVYYHMKSDTAGVKTAKIHIRFHLHEGG